MGAAKRVSRSIGNFLSGIVPAGRGSLVKKIFSRRIASPCLSHEFRINTVFLRVLLSERKTETEKAGERESNRGAQRSCTCVPRFVPDGRERDRNNRMGMCARAPYTRQTFFRCLRIRQFVRCSVEYSFVSGKHHRPSPIGYRSRRRQRIRSDASGVRSDVTAI